MLGFTAGVKVTRLAEKPLLASTVFTGVVKSNAVMVPAVRSRVNVPVTALLPLKELLRVAEKLKLSVVSARAI